MIITTQEQAFKIRIAQNDLVSSVNTLMQKYQLTCDELNGILQKVAEDWNQYISAIRRGPKKKGDEA